MQCPITLSHRAQEHIRRQLEQTESRYLRLGLKESGCNGHMYTLDFLVSPSAKDQCYEMANGVRVCVDEDDLVHVVGTEVDMVTEGLNSALVFKNPNAGSYCGCGESFAFADKGAQGDASEIDVKGLASNAGIEAS